MQALLVMRGCLVSYIAVAILLMIFSSYDFETHGFQIYALQDYVELALVTGLFGVLPASVAALIFWFVFAALKKRVSWFIAPILAMLFVALCFVVFDLSPPAFVMVHTLVGSLVFWWGAFGLQKSVQMSLR